MPHRPLQVNLLICESSFRILSPLFSDFEPLFLHVEVKTLAVPTIETFYPLFTGKGRDMDTKGTSFARKCCFHKIFEFLP